jgi:hypothetical protein
LKRPKGRWGWSSTGAPVGRLVPAHHPGAARARLLGGDACSGWGRKRGGLPLREELLPLTVPEVRRLLWMPAHPVPQSWPGPTGGGVIRPELSGVITKNGPRNHEAIPKIG